MQSVHLKPNILCVCGSNDSASFSLSTKNFSFAVHCERLLIDSSFRHALKLQCSRFQSDRSNAALLFNNLFLKNSLRFSYFIAKSTPESSQYRNLNPNLRPKFDSQKSDAKNDDLVIDQLVVMSVNIEDMTINAIRYIMNSILSSGAEDVWLINGIMKSGNPGIILNVLCQRKHADPLLRIILKETNSVSVRVTPCEYVSVQVLTESSYTPWGWISVKVAYLDGNLLSAKPNEEECVAAAKKHNVPLKVVLEAARENFFRAEQNELRNLGLR